MLQDSRKQSIQAKIMNNVRFRLHERIHSSVHAHQPMFVASILSQMEKKAKKMRLLQRRRVRASTPGGLQSTSSLNDVWTRSLKATEWSDLSIFCCCKTLWGSSHCDTLWDISTAVCLIKLNENVIPFIWWKTWMVILGNDGRFVSRDSWLLPLLLIKLDNVPNRYRDSIDACHKFTSNHNHW